MGAYAEAAYPALGPDGNYFKTMSKRDILEDRELQDFGAPPDGFEWAPGIY